jgi:membrane fusion protein (multidrug efflux system)
MGEVAPMTSPGVPGREYEARIELVGNSADPLTGNFVVKLTVNNSDRRLRAGMSVRLRLKGMQRENTLLIPKSALVDRNRRRVVFRLVDGRAQEVEPLIGVSNDDNTPVYGGLQAGDQLILAPLKLIQDGKQVSAIVAPTTATADQPATAADAETTTP